MIERLDELVQTAKDRIKADTGLEVEPIYYSAGCEIDGEVLSRPYNLQKLLSFILDRLPKKKRAAIALYVNENTDNFQSNDNKENYQGKVEESIFSSFLDYVKDVAGDTFKKVGVMAKEAITDPENIKWFLTIVIGAIKGMKKIKE